MALSASAVGFADALWLCSDRALSRFFASVSLLDPVALSPLLHRVLPDGLRPWCAFRFCGGASPLALVPLGPLGSCGGSTSITLRRTWLVSANLPCGFGAQDLRKVGEWSKKWQMPFNLDKCKIMHIGHKNKNEKYELLGKEIESVQQEKYLGVVITNDLKSSNQCIEAVKKAQKLLGYIKRQFRTRNKETILTLYNALVRPHLEYAVQFWSPSLRKDIERLEAEQARATKLYHQLDI